MPEWYVVLATARYLGVAPWELAEQPAAWLTWAQEAMRAEGEAQAQRQRRG